MKIFMSKRVAEIGARSAGVVAAIALISSPINAFAAEPPGSDASADVTASALHGIDAEDTQLLLDPVEGSDVGSVPMTGGSTTLPLDLAAGVSLSSTQGDSLHISLPDAATAGDPQVLSGGSVTYPGSSSANSVIVGDAGVQMLTTIVDRSAPTSYAYEVQLAEGERLELIDGGAAIVDAAGAVIVVVAEPWAVDAEGVDVPTRYDVSGSTLTQWVEHDRSGVTYPVVADPIWLAPWVVRCLAGIGLSGPQIAQIASAGSPGAIFAAFGRGAIACVFGR